MPRYIVPDTCAIATSLYNETYSSNADPLLEAIRLQSVDAIAPSSCFTEFFNVSRKKADGDRNNPPLPASQVEAVVADFLALPILWLDIEPFASTAWQLHRDYGIQTGDAFFVAVAQLWQAELWTKDNQFITTVTPIYASVYDLKVQAYS